MPSCFSSGRIVVGVGVAGAVVEVEFVDVTAMVLVRVIGAVVGVVVGVVEVGTVVGAVEVGTVVGIIVVGVVPGRVVVAGMVVAGIAARVLVVPTSQSGSSQS